MIILQEKYKALIVEYVAIRTVFFTFTERDEDIEQKVKDANALFVDLTNRYWALSSVFAEIKLNLEHEVRKTASMKPAHGGGVCVSCPADTQVDSRER